MAQVNLWSSALVNSMENKIPEELAQIAVACLTPLRIVSVLRPLVDETQLGDQRKESAILVLLR